MQRTTIRVALDWTPNTNHTGLYLAQQRMIYDAAGLDVQLLPPDEKYSLSPSKRLAAGEVDLAICPSESCIAFAENGKMHLQAIYALLQRDASAIASAKLSRPSELGDGKVYGSYDARYEDTIVKAVVAKDGGNAEGMKIERQKGKLSLFDAVKAGEIDATWVFLPWEGVEAEEEGLKANYFSVGDHDIPYGYSPVIARKVGEGGLDEKTLKKFIKATREGYEMAELNVEAAVRALKPHCRPERSVEFLTKSQERVNKFYSDGSELGTMSEQKWGQWIAWLEENKLMEAGVVKSSQLYTNEFHYQLKA